MALPHLYLCRHGQTDWNAELRLQGQEDVPLNALGRIQAKRNGRYLANVLGSSAGSFRFFASPMSRTRETMRILRAELGLDPEAFETDARLIELNFGDWQGSTLTEVSAREPDALAEREAKKWTHVPPGEAAESYEMLARRVAPVFEELSGPSIIVAHGGVARSFLRLHGGLSPVDAAHVTIPQDRILEWKNGAAAWV